MKVLEFRSGLKAATPTMIGYVSIGLAYGVVASETGLTPLETLLTSLFIYSGSGQFILCALLLAKADLSGVFLTIFLTNLRYFLLNLHAATIFSKASFLNQLFNGLFMTDESYGVLLGERLKHEMADISTSWMHGNNLSSYFSWVIASLIGGLVGNVLPDPNALGLDFALVAMFIVIFSGQLENLAMHLPLKKIGVLLAAVTVVYLLSSMVITGSLAMLLATVVACCVGVMIDV